MISPNENRDYTEGAGFHVRLPHRESFSPDAAYHIGSRTGMRFLEGAPAFAVEVRSENDYGPAAEREIADAEPAVLGWRMAVDELLGYQT